MKLSNGKKTYDARVLSETKVPKFVRGNYVTKDITIDGKKVEFKYDEKRKTGLYFKMNGKNLYFAERDILKETSLTTKVADEKPEASKKAKKSKVPPPPHAQKGAEKTIQPIEG